MSVMLFTGPEGKSQLRIANTVGAVGIELALSPAVGWLLGRFADQHFSSAPLGSYLGARYRFSRRVPGSISGRAPDALRADAKRWERRRGSGRRRRPVSVRPGLDRIAWTIAAAGAVISGLSFLFGAIFRGDGLTLGVGALVGSVVAVADWTTVRWLVQLSFGGGNRLAVAVLLLSKMGVLVGVSYALLKFAGVDVLGFTLGFSSLVLGIVLGARELGADAEATEVAAMPEKPLDA